MLPDLDPRARSASSRPGTRTSRSPPTLRTRSRRRVRASRAASASRRSRAPATSRGAGSASSRGRRLHDREGRLRSRARARRPRAHLPPRRPRALTRPSCTRSVTGWRTRGSSPTSSASTRGWRGPGSSCSCYDTLGQGERRAGWHQHGQLAPLLVGFTTLGVMVAETLAALDCCAEREDVDAGRLGLTGASGGGFVSTFAAAVDTRVAAAAICCILNTHAAQVRDAAFGTGWDGWVDLCNQVPRLAATASMGMVLGAAAPGRVTVVHAIDDPPFPIAGARAVVAEAARDLRRRSEPAAARASSRSPAGTACIPRCATPRPRRSRRPSALTRRRRRRRRWRSWRRPTRSRTRSPARTSRSPRRMCAHPAGCRASRCNANVDTNSVLVRLARDRALQLRQGRDAVARRTAPRSSAATWRRPGVRVRRHEPRGARTGLRRSG